MKKTITLLFSVSLALSISAQNFGLGMDYMISSGTIIEDDDGVPVKNADGDDVSGSSAVLNLNYTHNLYKELDMIGSVGYGMGFGLVPMKLNMSYGLTSKMDVNAGMGMYIITDDSYKPAKSIDGAEESWKGSSNEFGIDFGVNYQMNAIGIGLGYHMIKGDGNNTLNAFAVGVSYAFGGESKDKTVPKEKKVVAPKKVIAPKKFVAPKKDFIVTTKIRIDKNSEYSIQSLTNNLSFGFMITEKIMTGITMSDVTTELKHADGLENTVKTAAEMQLIGRYYHTQNLFAQLTAPWNSDVKSVSATELLYFGGGYSINVLDDLKIEGSYSMLLKTDVNGDRKGAWHLGLAHEF